MKKANYNFLRILPIPRIPWNRPGRKETFIFENHAKPKLIVCNFSKVLINACLFEFNGETFTVYLDQIYKNLVENEEICTYKTVSHVCAAHLLRVIKVSLQKYYKLD